VACKALNLGRSSYYYQAKEKGDCLQKEKIKSLSEKYPQEGYRMLCHRLRNEGEQINHKRFYRLYTELGLHLKVQKKKRLPDREALKLVESDAPNQCWSMDFMSDSLVHGRKFRTLNVCDDFNREVLGIELGTSMPAKTVVNTLERLIDWHGKPAQIRVDNGPEYISETMKTWCERHKITLLYIQPGKPTQNAYIERFNGTYRKYVLDAYEFRNMGEVRKITEEFVKDYNETRPHSALGYLSPEKYKQQYYANQSNPDGASPVRVAS
jgi:putative transposase